jgi:pectin methylesterase-like acyl-CoA thioesterase
MIPAADITVCAQGCDFTSLKAALKAESTTAGLVISLEDAVHTEAGIIVNKDVTIQGKDNPRRSSRRRNLRMRRLNGYS